MILLRVVHRHEQALRDGRVPRRRRTSSTATATRHVTSRNRHDRHCVGGMALFDQLELATRLRHERALRVRENHVLEMRRGAGRVAALAEQSRPLELRLRRLRRVRILVENLRPERDGRRSRSSALPESAPRAAGAATAPGGVCAAAWTNCAGRADAVAAREREKRCPIAGALSALRRAINPSADASSGDASVPPRSSARADLRFPS